MGPQQNSPPLLPFLFPARLLLRRSMSVPLRHKLTWPMAHRIVWFMMHRIRLALQFQSFEKVSGEVVADRTFIGGRVGVHS
jgi:hypothetical protein